MGTICPNGHGQADGARFCGVCGARVASPFAPGSVASSAGRSSSGLTAALVAAAVVLVALVIGGAVLLIGGDGPVVAGNDPDPTAPSPGPTASSATSTSSTASSVALVPSGGGESAGGGPSDPSLTPPAPTAEGAWITALSSIEESDPATAQAKRDELDAQYGGVSMMRTSDYASLTPGYYVIYRGPFATGDEAIAECFRLDRTTRHLCFAAPLSHSSADRDERRYPD